jgi:broad specificity phosphatase PhoE
VNEAPWKRIRERGHLAITFLRHGETVWNREKRFLGTTDLGLSEIGLNQAKEVAAAYAGKFDAVYSSPLRRAFETAEAVGESPTKIDAFAELYQGALEGLTFPDAIARYPDFFKEWAVNPATAAVPGGETLKACEERAHQALTTLCDNHALGQGILVVSHQMVIAALSCVISGDGLLAWREYTVGNVQASVFSWDGLSLSLETGGWHPAPDGQ